jgi:hypothetical protein
MSRFARAVRAMAGVLMGMVVEVLGQDGGRYGQEVLQVSGWDNMLPWIIQRINGRAEVPYRCE